MNTHRLTMVMSAKIQEEIKVKEIQIIYSVRNKNIQIASGIRTSFQIDQRRFLKQMAFRLGPEGWASRVSPGKFCYRTRHSQ